jgi:hypothetical protein
MWRTLWRTAANAVQCAATNASFTLAAAAAQIEDAFDQPELGSFDSTTADTYVGTYTSAALGEITLVAEDNLLVMDAGEFRTRLIPLMQQADPQQPVVMMADPPLVGLTLPLRQNDAGEPEVVLSPRGAAEEVFTRLP